MSQVVCLEQSNTMLGRDTSTLVPNVIKYPWLQGRPDLLGCVEVVKALHNCVEMKVAVCDVTVTEDDSSVWSDTFLGLEDNILEVLGV